MIVGAQVSVLEFELDLLRLGLMASIQLDDEMMKECEELHFVESLGLIYYDILKRKEN